MPEDSLSVKENPDGSFEISWDDKDPKWCWMNGLTSEQVQIIFEQAIKNHLAELETKNDL
jgi:hypothetical protein